MPMTRRIGGSPGSPNDSVQSSTPLASIMLSASWLLLSETLRRSMHPADAGLAGSEELEHAAAEQCSCVRVVGRQAVIGEQVLIAGVEKQLCVGRRDELPGGVDVTTVLDEERVSVHGVDLHGNIRRPRRRELRRRRGRVEEQR